MIHFKTSAAAGWISAADLGLEFTRFRRLDLGAGAAERLTTVDTELCAVVLSGSVRYACTVAGVARPAETIGAMDMLFIPPDSVVELAGTAARAGTVAGAGTEAGAAAATRAVVALYEAPSELGADFACVRFAEIDASPAKHHTYGKAQTGCEREVWNFIDADFRCSRLMMGICMGRDGGWTAWPPHEHAAEREEVYVYFDMRGSFALQCVYEDLGDPGAVAVVRDFDLVSIPKGYHPNVGAPAGRIKYIYCMTAKKPGARDFMELRIQPEFGTKFE